MVGGTAQGRPYCGIKFQVCIAMFFHPKKGQNTMVGTRLPETQSTHNQGQDTITADFRGY